MTNSDGTSHLTTRAELTIQSLEEKPAPSESSRRFRFVPQMIAITSSNKKIRGQGLSTQIGFLVDLPE